MMTRTMKAMLLDAAGAPFRAAQVDRPKPDDRQVLVRIHASGINPLDTKIRAGVAPHARHPLPAILGLDLAGVVEETGSAVTRFRRGDEVYGMTGGVGGIPGTLAEYAAVDADLLALKPANLSMREAAALPLVLITAWEGLVDHAHVAAGQAVLVQGGAGGVGHIVVQLARANGARVFATASVRDADYLRSIGAEPIDRDEAVRDYVARHTAGVGFDIAYDAAGGTALDASFAAIRRRGHVVSALGRGSYDITALSLKAGTYSGIATLLPLLTGEGRAHHGEILAEGARLAEAGKLMPRLDPRRFTLDEATAAHDALTGRTAEGKLVVSLL